MENFFQNKFHLTHFLLPMLTNKQSSHIPLGGSKESTDEKWSKSTSGGKYPSKSLSDTSILSKQVNYRLGLFNAERKCVYVY